MNYDTDHRLIAEIGQSLPPDPRAILEIGCGDGRLSVLLACCARTYVALDPDAEAIRKAQALASQVDFRIGTGEDLDFADASFDVVLFILSLHHQDSRIALEEAHRVLAPEGRLIVLEPSAEGELQQFFHLFNDEQAALAEAAASLEHCGFQRVDHRVFEVPAEFDSPEDLCRYPFDRTTSDATDHARILDKLQQLRGPFPAAGVLQLRDTLHLYALRKAPPLTFLPPRATLIPDHGHPEVLA